MDGWYGRIYRGCGYFDPDKPIKKFNKKELNDLLYREPTKIKVDDVNLTYAGLIPQIQKSFLSKDIDSLQPHVRRFVEQAVVFTTCPDCDGTRLAEEARSSKIKGINIADACAMQITDLAGWLTGRQGEIRGAAGSGAAAHARLVRRDRPGLPEPGPPVGNALGRRGPAHQDDPPARLLADRRDLRLRRADHRPPPARHRADERAAAAAARQGQHGAGRGAQAGGDRERRPRRRSRSRRGQRRGRGGVRGHGRGAAGQRHRDRPPSGRPRVPQGVGAHVGRRAGGAWRGHPQPAGRGRGHSARRARGGHGRRGIGQELADRRLGGRPRRGGVDRPDRHPRLQAQQPRDVLRAARPDPQGVREGQRREARAVQRQLRRRLPELQRRRRDLHRPRHDGRRLLHLRGVRRQAVRRRGPGVRVRRQGHQPGAARCR